MTACSRRCRTSISSPTQGYRDSGELLDLAIALDPSYAQAHAYYAWRLNFWIGEGRSL